MAIATPKPTVLERVVATIAGAAGFSVVAKAAKPLTQPPYASYINRFRATNGSSKRGARLLRQFSETNPVVRGVINRRKHALARAKFSLVRLDDPRQAPDPTVVKRFNDLTRFMNPTMESFETVTQKIAEDILVLDAGCIEKVRNVGGEIIALWPVDGATITVDGRWELTANPNSPRYRQYEDFRLQASLRNDQLIYMQHNPRTNTPIGWSPVETLVKTIESLLYADDYDDDYLKQNMPQGILDLGPGTSAQALEAFREYYEREIAGTRSLAITGSPDPSVNATVKFNPFTRTDTIENRLEYKKWLATLIATVFEIDLTAVGIVESVNRANGKTGQEQSDTGLVGLASTIARYYTRELVWEIDPDGTHGFVFDGLVPRDELTQAKIDQVYSGIGVYVPNDIRTREGLPRVEWGDEPYNAQGTATPDPLDEDEQQNPDDEDEKPKATGSKRALVPFGRASLAGRTPSTKRRSSTNSTA